MEHVYISVYFLYNKKCIIEPNGNAIGHERLAIIDPESGAQPLVSRDRKIVVAANGEIYNYKELYAELETAYSPLTGSDCEVVIPLYQQVKNYQYTVHPFTFIFPMYFVAVWN
jgi:asparagine synthetase B (glutamine-hydrolysing)